MEFRKLIHQIGIGLSSLVSILAGHSLHASNLEMKDISKKKLRPASALGSEKDSASSAAPGQLENPPDRGEDRYPWKRQIVTTTFWIGETPTENNPVPNHKSSWDTRWAENYGGTDTPNRAKRSADFRPAAFTPGQNPFYVALPYNDKMREGHKPEASKVIPWFAEAYAGPGKSVCKDRWIAIRFKNRICYAQWEDVGPFRTDHWQYVFGDERPRPNLNRGAGLDVSPAVRDYLGMADTDVTDWKFVEFADIPQGPWARYGGNNTFVIHRLASEKEKMAILESASRPNRGE